MAYKDDKDEEQEGTIAEGAVGEVLDEDEEETLPDLGIAEGDEKGWE